MSTLNVMLALLWECWRFSRRWYLWVLPLIIAVDFGLMQLVSNAGFSPAILADPMLPYRIVAVGVFSVNFVLATFASLLAMTAGGKAGFPLGFEFRLPISSSVLVGVPMLALALLCASLYYIPMLLCRLYYGVQFPLLPASALLATLVIMLLAGSWSTTSTLSRTVAMLAAFIGSLNLFATLDPMNYPRSRRGIPGFLTNDIMVLEPMEYAALAVLSLLLFGLAVFSIRQQRYGEVPTLGLSALLRKLKLVRGDAYAAAASAPSTLERLADLLAPPCPVGSPLRAELWLEAKRHAIPILLSSLVVALMIPLVLSINISGPSGLRSLDYFFPLAVFMTGAGIAIFNRRQHSAGYMSTFEASRGMSTVAMALIQLLSLGASVLAGIALVSISLYFSNNLFDEAGSFGTLLQSLVKSRSERPLLVTFSAGISLLALYLCVMAGFVAIHVCSMVWGRVFSYSVIAVAFYSVIFTFAMLRDAIELQTLQQHIWGFAIVVLALTLLALGKTVYWKLLSLRASMGGLLCWGVFLACSLYVLSQRGIELSNLPPELKAFNAALLSLPLMLFLVLLWCYDRLRHR